MIRMLNRLALTLALLSGLSFAADKAAPAAAKVPGELTVAAAASLQGALDEIQKDLKKDIPVETLKVSYGASGALQKQIIQGAPIDIFLSAAEKPVVELAEKGLLAGESRMILGNSLVLIAKKGSKLKSIADLKGIGIKRLALGEPRSVPAGDYAMQLLDSQKLSADLQSKFVYAKDVRQVLTYVQSGEVDAGFVYKSDLYQLNDVDLIATAPDGSHKPIRYAAAVIKSSKNAKAAQTVVNLLGSEKAAKIWEKYGFQILTPKTHGAH